MFHAIVLALLFGAAESPAASPGSGAPGSGSPEDASPRGRSDFTRQDFEALDEARIKRTLDATAKLMAWSDKLAGEGKSAPAVPSTLKEIAKTSVKEMVEAYRHLGDLKKLEAEMGMTMEAYTRDEVLLMLAYSDLMYRAMVKQAHEAAADATKQLQQMVDDKNLPEAARELARQQLVQFKQQTIPGLKTPYDIPDKTRELVARLKGQIEKAFRLQQEAGTAPEPMTPPAQSPPPPEGAPSESSSPGEPPPPAESAPAEPPAAPEGGEPAAQEN
jgi:hypothetical protein